MGGHSCFEIFGFQIASKVESVILGSSEVERPADVEVENAKVEERCLGSGEDICWSGKPAIH